MNDAEFSKLIRDRDGWCLNCGRSSHLQAAHILRRSYKLTRFDEDNAVTLCLWCHHYFTHHPLEWNEWVEDRYPGRISDLRDRAGLIMDPHG